MTTTNLLSNLCVLVTTLLAFASGINPGQVIKVTGRRFYLTGQTLVLNCTTIINSYHNRNLSWTKDGKELQGKLIGSNNLQLVKHKVKSTDGGGYRCVVRQQTQDLRSVSIHVTVGDIPSKPTNTGWRGVGHSICVHWSPVTTTGTLPVTYRLHYRCVSQCALAALYPSYDNLHYATCKNNPPHPGQKMRCCLNDVDLYVGYEGVVDATNVFGTSSSKPFNFTRNIQFRPGPPRSLKVLAEGYGEISLEWTSNSHSLFDRKKYIIYYSAQGDEQNKTITTDSNCQNYYRITNLKPYTNYTIYLAAIDPIFKEIGIPAGPVTIVTREENPSDAPQITEWHSVLYPDNKNLRNVTVYWKLPRKETWNGRITKYVIQYQRIPRLTEEIAWGQHDVIDNSSTTEGTLVGLRIDSAYNVDMQMCNGAGCGGIGNRVIINAIAEPIQGGTKQAISKGIVTVCVALVTILTILLAVVIIMVKFKKTKHAKSINSQYLNLKEEKV